MIKLLFLAILILFLNNEIHASNVSTTGAISYFGLSAKIGKYETLNFNHSDVFNFSKKTLKGEKFRAGVEETSFQINYSYQLLPHISLTGGYTFEREIFQENNESRIFQQITFAKIYRSLTTTHRFRFEERFINNSREDDFEFGTRFRYQFGINFPLRGLVTDPGEFFVNAYNESYFSTSGERNSFFNENWLYGGLGYQTNNLGSFELGPTMQWVTINNEKDSRTHLTLQLGWVFSY